MMLLLIKKNPSSPFHALILTRTSTFHHLLKFSFSSASVDDHPPPKFNFMTEYLITSCGFSPQKAATASKHIAGVASPEKPDSVRHFLKQHGFTDTNIRSIISGSPGILSADVDQTLEPNLKALRKMGFAEHELPKLIIRNPRALLPSAIPRIEFWRTLLNGNTKDLIAALSRNRGLINRDIDKSVVAMISLLKEYGLSESDIRLVIVRGRGLFTRSTAALEVLLKRVQELGLRPGSPIFVDVLSALGSLRPDLFLARMELFRSLGWSEGEFLAALKKSPAFTLLTEENIREKMEFLVEKAGCTQSYIASRPSILTFSLKKRLMPRHYMINILKSMELVWGEWDFRTLMCIPEKKFVDTFILQHKNEAPRLLEMYDAACAGEFLSD